MLEGWILDIHPDLKKDAQMVIWLKQRNGRTISLSHSWAPSIYVYTESKEDYDRILYNPEVRSLISNFNFEEKFAEITDENSKQVLSLTLKNAKNRVKLAKTIYCSAPYGRYQIYNADIDPAQVYMYEHDLFPLAYVGVYESNGKLEWDLLDSIEDIHYEIPNLKQLQLTVNYEKKGSLIKPTDPITSVELLLSDGKISIEGSEKEILLQLVSCVREIDPDIIYTENGDYFLIPSLMYRAHIHNVDDKVILGRYDEPIKLPKSKGGTYFSYGKVIYKPRPVRFFGRIHIDKANSFVHAECGLQGLIEVARTCRVPLDTAARASIGRIMTSIEFYHAYKNNILIPWKPTLAERFKNGWELMIGDRGGFIFEPKVGVHDNVGEIDFSSLYPTLMFKNNISAESICCECCRDSKLRVPELDWNICEKRVGIIPKGLDLLLRKRARYKKLRKSTEDNNLRSIYDARQSALKWILVSCFGYLGFRNAKFGRIDAHMAVCAFARKTMFDAVRIVEGNAYEIVHGIVDSLWLKKRNASEDDYTELCVEIEKQTDLPLSFEGIYKWIAFLPSKMYNGLPVINRYFGVFKNGEIKIRGIEARKHDTPEFIKRCQLEMLEVMAEYSSSQEVRENMDKVVRILEKHLAVLEHRNVPIEELIINKRLSKNGSDYKKDILQAIVSRQLAEHGRKLNAGESISYNNNRLLQQ